MIRLVRGHGSESGGASWMSALHWLTRTDSSWSHEPAGVSPVIRRQCQRLNDLLNDAERGAVIQPHLFTPLGTDTGADDELRRALLAADRAIRIVSPVLLRHVGGPLAVHAATLESLKPVDSVEAAKAAAETTGLVDSKLSIHRDFRMCLRFVRYAECLAKVASSGDDAEALEAEFLSWFPYQDSAAESPEARRVVIDHLLGVIVDGGAIGARVEVATRKREELIAWLSR